MFAGKLYRIFFWVYFHQHSKGATFVVIKLTQENNRILKLSICFLYWFTYCILAKLSSVKAYLLQYSKKFLRSPIFALFMVDSWTAKSRHAKWACLYCMYCASVKFEPQNVRWLPIHEIENFPLYSVSTSTHCSIVPTTYCMHVHIGKHVHPFTCSGATF